jgi:precorrin-8X/cobalt-precorrin-8 methylmutase
MAMAGMNAQSLALIDQKLGDLSLRPAESELVKRVIYHTADWDYAQILHFSPSSLSAGAAALAARTPIVVDVPMVQVAVQETIRVAFSNSLYCCQETVTIAAGLTPILEGQKERTQDSSSSRSASERGLSALLRLYPQAIVVVGQERSMLTQVLDWVEAGKVRPALLIVTAPHLEETDPGADAERLDRSDIPWLGVSGSKGGAGIAASLLAGLVELTWQAYNPA